MPVRCLEVHLAAIAEGHPLLSSHCKNHIRLNAQQSLPEIFYILYFIFKKKWFKRCARHIEKWLFLAVRLNSGRIWHTIWLWFLRFIFFSLLSCKRMKSRMPKRWSVRKSVPAVIRNKQQPCWFRTLPEIEDAEVESTIFFYKNSYRRLLHNLFFLFFFFLKDIIVMRCLYNIFFLDESTWKKGTVRERLRIMAASWHDDRYGYTGEFTTAWGRQTHVMFIFSANVNARAWDVSCEQKDNAMAWLNLLYS